MELKMNKCNCDGGRCAVPEAVKDEVKDDAPIVPSTLLSRSAEVDDMSVPIRTVMYVEVGNLPSNEVRDVTASLMQTLHPGHPHFVVPLRNGKMLTDLDFERELLDFVQLICEIESDGGSGARIVLKGGCHDVDVIRVRV
jgi:hypothetical protein